MNSNPWRKALGIVLLLIAVGCRPADSLSGVVQDVNGRPIAGAVVRVRTTTLSTRTDEQGRFSFSDLPPGQPLALTAWAPGYFIAGLAHVRPGASELHIRLSPYPGDDNPGYRWVSAFAEAGEVSNCQNCHASTEAEAGSALPFDEWQQDVHAHTTQNVRFLTMYSGTDVNGNQSPARRYGFNRDYGRFPLPPDPNKPYYGPGYKLDFPDTAGNCAACHAPAAAVDAPYGTDPREVSGVGAEGVACDFCHKVSDVKLGPDGLPLPNMPGVLSFEFRRPPEGHQFFAGPLDDVGAVPPVHPFRRFCVVCHPKQQWLGWPYATEDTRVPILTRSTFCAPCHVGSFWNVRIYNSFGEWLESPYSDPERAAQAGLQGAQTCQDCHMRPGKSDHFVRFERGGLRRDPQTIFSHNMTITPDLLRQALRLETGAERQDGQIVVTVTVTNSGAGHHVPTDSPLRQVILLVQATDAGGKPLPLLNGPTLPGWVGCTPGTSTDTGCYAGLPGALYAKTLEEMWTEIAPTGAYWNLTRILSDTRLPALASDTTTYTFQAPASPCKVSVRLLYRRAFPELAQQKGWEVPEILLAERRLLLPSP